MDNKRMLRLAGVPVTETIVEDVEMLIEMEHKPKAGQAFGTNDQAAPEDNTPEELSRVADLLYAARVVGGKELAKKIFAELSQEIKGEFNYSKWKYVS